MGSSLGMLLLRKMQWLEAQGKAWVEALDSGVISQKAGAETARVV